MTDEVVKNDVRELVIVVLAALAPMWFMAGDLSDLDEVIKSGVGVACVGAVVAIYRIYKMKSPTSR